ncbi:MAG: NYN domain-containing protein [Fuerstiella sp.]
MTQNQPGLFPDQQKKRAIVYIDGFNLYNGSIKGTTHKWLNLEKYFEKLRQHEEVLRIDYFTARMHGDSGVRQETHLRALSTLPKLRVIAGNYKRKSVKCRVGQCEFGGNRRFSTWEEKRTDVNIAVQMVADALAEEADVQIVVSGDSDLVPALHKVKEMRPGIKLVVYVPARDEQRGAATEIRAAADKNATLPMALLKSCHFPVEVPDGSGGKIMRPERWGSDVG